MTQRSKESQINLAVQAKRSDPTVSLRHIAKTFNVAELTLRSRMNGTRARQDVPSNRSRLTELEENMIVIYIIDLDSRGFTARILDVEDIANIILATRHALRVGTR